MKNKKNNGFYYVESEYNTVFINAMKSLGGKWESKETAWKIDERNWGQLSTVLIDLFGYNGIDHYEKCTIIVDAISCSKNNVMNIGLYNIGKRWSRDSGVSLTDKCSVVSGGFDESGGSRNSPKISAKKGTRIKILDFPCALISQIKGDYQIIDGVESISDEIKITTDKLIIELQKRGYIVSKKENIPQELIDEN